MGGDWSQGLTQNGTGEGSFELNRDRVVYLLCR